MLECVQGMLLDDCTEGENWHTFMQSKLFCLVAMSGHMSHSCMYKQRAEPILGLQCASTNHTELSSCQRKVYVKMSF